MLGSTPLTAVLGSGVDPTDHAAVKMFIRAACGQGLALLLCHPGTKVPADMRTSRTRNADDKAAQEAAKEAGRRDWAKVKSPSGLALASTDPKVVIKYLDEYIKHFSNWWSASSGKNVGWDKKLADAGEIVMVDPVAVNLAVEVGASRLVVVDCDIPEQVARFREVAQAGADIPPTVLSPGQQDADGTWVHSDGGHFYFTVPEGVTLPSNLGAMTWGGDHGFAVLWNRRYVLIPPSVRKEGAYELAGREYPLPAFLREAIEKTARVRSERFERNTPTDGDLKDTIDEWSETISWSDILSPLGWSPAPRSDNCGCDVWTGPGVHASTKSATAHDAGCQLGRYTETNAPLHIWTDNPGEPFAQWVADHHTQTISKLQAVALTEYNGAIGAAMDALGLMPAPTTIEVESGVDNKAIGSEDGVDKSNLDQDLPFDEGGVLSAGLTEITNTGPVDTISPAQLTKRCDHCDGVFPAEEFTVGDFGVVKHRDHWDPYTPEADKPVVEYSEDESGHVTLTFNDPTASPAEIKAALKAQDQNPFAIAGVTVTEITDQGVPATDFPDEVEAPDPDVFESDTNGVPRIAPASHWMDMPPPEYVIDGLIEHGGLSCIIGPPGVGKSTVAIDLACHIATGKAWQGRRTLKTRVLYLPGEGLSGTVQRIKAWCDAHDTELDDNLLLGNDIIQLGATVEAWAEVAAYIARQEIGLIIFDTFARMSLGMEENSATDVGRAVRRFDQVRKLTRAGVLVVHHTAKGSESGRGSSALNGALDSELLVREGTWDTAGISDENGNHPGKALEVLTSKQKNAEQLDEPLPLMMVNWTDTAAEINAPLITGPNGEVDPMAGDIVLARPRPEPVVETAIRIARFVQRFPEQGVTRTDIVAGIQPDPYTRSRADTVKHWKIKVAEGVDKALRRDMIQTLSGTPSGARYIPDIGTAEAAREAEAAEIMAD